MTLHLLAWVLGGDEGTAGTSGLWMPWLPPATATYGLEGHIYPGRYQINVRWLRIVPYLQELGVEVRHVPWSAGISLEERLCHVKAAMEWADVVWMRGSEVISWLCGDCEWEFGRGRGTPYEHYAKGHRVFPDNLEARGLWAEVQVRKRLGLVVDADDMPAELPAWWIKQHPTQLGNPIREADLVTVATPALARMARRYSARVRVIPNAVSASWYLADQPRPDGPTRLVWYGAADRQRDYTGRTLFPNERASYCRQAVEDNRADLRTIYIGSNPLDPEGALRMRQAGFDEVHPSAGWRKFPHILGNSWPEIGVAPLIITPWRSAKSEMHWLELSVAGAAVVAERWPGGPGPYDVIRDGVDGFLAHGRQEWSDAIGRLARSPQLRADIGGAARERMATEYDPHQRAEELRDAYLWAANHAGINRGSA